jgi:hypothetical protein
LISIPLSHFPNDRNLRKRLRICAEMKIIPVDGLTSV